MQNFIQPEYMSNEDYECNETAMAVVLSLGELNEKAANCVAFLDAELAKRSLIRHRVKGDGHCQLHAVKHQLRDIIELPDIPELRQHISAVMTSNFSGLCEYSQIREPDDIRKLRRHISNFKEMRNNDSTIEWGSLETLYQIACTYNLKITLLRVFTVNSWPS